MKSETENKIEYIIALIHEFGKAHNLQDNQAWIYIKRFGGIELIDNNYNFIHTQSFSSVISDLTIYINDKGGKIK